MKLKQKQQDGLKQNYLPLIGEILALAANYIAAVSIFLILCGSFSTEKVKAGMLCLFFVVPAGFFVIRKKCKKLLPFIGMHLAVMVLWGLLLYIGKNPFIEWFCYFLLSTVYIILSFVAKGKQGKEHEEPLHPAVFVGVLLVGFGVLDYAESSRFQPCLVLFLVLFLGIYFAHYYLENYLNFVQLNKISDRNFQKQKLFGTGGLFVGGYLGLVLLVLLFMANPAIGHGLSALIKVIGWWILKLLLLLFRGEAVEESVVEETVNSSSVLKQEELLNVEPGIFARLVDAMLEFAFYVLLALALVYAIRFLARKLRAMFFVSSWKQVQEEEHKDADITESLEKEESIRRQPLFYGMSVNGRIRKSYAKFMRGHQKKLEEQSKRPISNVTARESLNCFEEIGHVASIYEKARYSGEECQMTELRMIKKSLSKVPE